MTRVLLPLVGLLAATALALGGCGDDANRRAEEIGRQAADRLLTALKSELMDALRDGGPPAAVDVCAGRAQALTAEITRDLGIPGLAIKRTGPRAVSYTHLRAHET